MTERARERERIDTFLVDCGQNHEHLGRKLFLRGRGAWRGRPGSAPGPSLESLRRDAI